MCLISENSTMPYSKACSLVTISLPVPNYSPLKYRKLSGFESYKSQDGVPGMAVILTLSYATII